MNYQTTRGEVMEKGVAIEAGISGILGFIFDIDTKNSKSLGHQNSALSLNAKINLLTDLKFVPPEISKQFQLFGEIRNKFAHVYEVDTYTSCFEIMKDRKNYFLTFFNSTIADIDEETKYYMCFTFLCLHLGSWMDLILYRSHYLKSQELKKTTAIEFLRSFLKNKESEYPSASDKFHMERIDALIKDIEQDKDFLLSVQEAIKTGERNTTTTIEDLPPSDVTPS